MTYKKLDGIGVYGPVNGMSERDLRGDYYLASLTFEDDEVVRGRLTLNQVQELRDTCNTILTGKRDQEPVHHRWCSGEHGPDVPCILR